MNTAAHTIRNSTATKTIRFFATSGFLGNLTVGAVVLTTCAGIEFTAEEKAFHDLANKDFFKGQNHLNLTPKQAQRMAVQLKCAGIKVVVSYDLAHRTKQGENPFAK